ncbi:MAG: 16S rRNA (adenine(1518)-N(6)/adenine(1519)-N(6))-dimethyltransferase RsmA [Planctomycetota bacterium]|nr:16S rRNA (adenine(1518)-N(6)/adenine(1519)-N(6))-dimethyltransferase RsmA [Planctomycetota bacterium]
MQSLTEIKALLAERGLRPRHRFGQNFLHDHNLLNRLIDRSGVQRGDLVLEIGPGTGALTEPLVERGCRVIACEIDRDMCAIVRQRLGDRVTLIEGDCLDGKHAMSPAIVAAIGDEPVTLVANLPYQVATSVMANLLCDYPSCRGQYVTIQREVGDRLAALPGGDAWGPISVTMSILARVEMVASLPPSCFWPAPEVRSAMVAIEPIQPRPEVDMAALSPFLHTLFCKRRKQIGSILGRSFPFPSGIDPMLRPEVLTPAQILQLLAAAGTME